MTISAFTWIIFAIGTTAFCMFFFHKYYGIEYFGQSPLNKATNLIMEYHLLLKYVVFLSGTLALNLSLHKRFILSLLWAIVAILNTIQLVIYDSDE